MTSFANSQKRLSANRATSTVATKADRGRKTLAKMLIRTREGLDVARRGLAQKIIEEWRLRLEEKESWKEIAEVTLSDTTLGRIEGTINRKPPDIDTFRKLAPYIPDPEDLDYPISADKLYGIFGGAYEVGDDLIQAPQFLRAVERLEEANSKEVQQLRVRFMKEVSVDYRILGMLISAAAQKRGGVDKFAAATGVEVAHLEQLIQGRLPAELENKRVALFGLLTPWLTNPDTNKRFITIYELTDRCREGRPLPSIDEALNGTH